MKNAVKWSSLALAVAAGNGLLATQAMAEGEGFVEGATATLYSRTMYFNRDFRDNVGQSKADETATSFLMNFESGAAPVPACCPSTTTVAPKPSTWKSVAL